MIADILPGIDTRARGLWTLSGKVLEELTQPGQLFDPQRRKDLWEKGWNIFSPYMHPISRDIQEIVDKIGPTMVIKTNKQGLSFAVNSQVCLAMVILPEGAQISYATHNPLVHQFDAQPDHKLCISTTTLTDDYRLPSEGYKDSRGTIQPFMDRARKDRVQHGGFLVDNSERTVSILNHSQLSRASRRDLGDEEIVIEANWYMDSRNQDDVTSRRNLQGPQNYNSFGILEGEGQKRYFALTAQRAGETRRNARINLMITTYNRPTMRELAAFTNVVAKELEMSRWAMGGLEFNGGGVYIGKTKRATYTKGGYFVGYY